MDNILTVIGAVASVIGLIALLVAIIRYILMFERRADKAKDGDDIRSLESELDRANARNQQLRESIELANIKGPVALELKSQLDERLQRFMTANGATGASIYVPLTGVEGQINGLSFLTIEPYTRQNRLLKTKVIPLRSMAGRCFLSREAMLIKQVSPGVEHFEGAEELTNYSPASTVNIPVMKGEDAVAVLQLLRRIGDEPFTQQDLDQARILAKDVEQIVSELIKYPEIFGTMGKAPKDEGYDATTLFFDLSYSSILFREFSTRFALDLLNQFFEDICDVGFEHGGRLDNYLGDGALMRFSAPRVMEGHEISGAQAALAMASRFPSIRHYWTELNPALAQVQFRAGLAAGSLVEGAIGHSLVRNLGVAGFPISVSSALCAEAPRDRTAIWMDGDFAKRLGNQAVIKPIKTNNMTKVQRVANEMFELCSITSSETD